MSSHSDLRGAARPAGYYSREPYEQFCGTYFDVEEPVPGHYVKTEFDSRRHFDPTFAIGAPSRGGNHRRAFEEAPGRTNLQRTNAVELRNIGGEDRSRKFEHGTPSKSSFSETSVRRRGGKMRQAPKLLRQFLAEFLGTFLLVVFGDGAIAQYKMLDTNQMNFITIALGYGLALMIGILVSGNVSGGHLNPAVTLAMATIKKCSWKVIPVYWAAQYLGAFLGAAVVYGDYADGINANLGVNQTGAGIFSSFPNPNASVVTLVMDQALGTMCLLIIILAVTDKKNMNVISGLIPLLIGLGLAAIHLSLAFNAGCAINPARDLSPRILTYMAGFGTNVFTEAYYFFWIPWIIPHIGGVIGALTYYFMIEMHHPDDDDDDF